MKCFTFIALLLFICMSACSVDFEDNIRLQFKAQVRDQFGDPVENISVTLITGKDQGTFQGRRAILGEGFSDEQGKVAVTFLKPKGFETFYVWLNQPDDQTDYSDKFGSVRINRSFENIKQNEVTYNDLIVERTAELKIDLLNSGISGDTLRVVLRYPNQIKSIPEGEVYPEFKANSTFLLSGESYIYHLVPVLGGEVNLEYEVRNNGLKEEGGFTIPVTQPQQEFRYEYQ